MSPGFVDIRAFRFVLLTAFCAQIAGLSRAQDKPSSLPPLDPALFDPPHAAHLLSRAGFGGTPDDAKALAALGLEKAVESLLSPAAPESIGVFNPSLTEPIRLGALKDKSPEERKKALQERRRDDQVQFQKLRAWWLRRMVLTERPLEEKMTLFWHGHFATSQRDVKSSYHMWLQNQTIRAHALGNFKELVRLIAKDPAMLRYLDNNRNIRSHPNENFARELMELFTLGTGNYTEQDVKEGARALTGWTFRGNEFVFARRAHDAGEKTFLGKTGRFTGDDVIDIVFEQPATSRLIARKLFLFFAHEQPSEAVVEALAATLRESHFEVKPVLSQLFRSAELYSKPARGNRIKSPVELVVGTLRALRVDPGESPAFALLAGRMGQDLLLPPNVKGWDGGEAWISTSTLLDRYNFGRPILGLDETHRPARKDGARGDAKARLEARALRRVPTWDSAKVKEELLGKGGEDLPASEAVDRVVGRLLIVPLSEASRKKLKEFYASAKPATRLAELIHLIISSPEYQLG